MNEVLKICKKIIIANAKAYVKEQEFKQIVVVTHNFSFFMRGS